MDSLNTETISFNHGPYTLTGYCVRVLREGTEVTEIFGIWMR